MTITKYDNFAWKPIRCWECNKLFIFEWYNWNEIDISPCIGSVRRNYCKDCLKRRDRLKNVNFEI